MYPHNKYWKPLINFLHKKELSNQIFIGPEVLLYEFPKVFPYQILRDINLDDYDFEYIVFHKKLPEDLTNDYLDLIKEKYKPVWGNHLFVVYNKNRSTKEKLKALKYALYTNINFKKYYKPEKEKKQGIFITTYNRPENLGNLLKQIYQRPEEILVINDGSDEKFQAEYDKIKQDFPNISYIDNIKNMGLVFSMNTGYNYFLSDPDIDWIHYFQDDVVLRDDFFEVMDKVKDKKERPVITGMHREPHKIFEQKEINQVEVYLLRSAPAHHILLHRQYLQDNLPIPNPYIGAPKPNKGKEGQGSDADWYLLSWSPKSIVKKDKYIIAVPNLLTTDMSAEKSTWDIDK